MRFVVCICLAVGLLSSPGRAAPSTCMVEGAEKKVRPKDVQTALAKTKVMFKKKALHVLDLPLTARKLRERIDPAPASDEICAHYTDIVALQTAIGAIVVDEALLRDKLARVKRFSSGAELVPIKAKRAERLVGEAERQLEQRKLPKANATMNQALALILQSPDTWRLPDVLPTPKEDASAPPPTYTLQDDEVSSSCPALAKKSNATQDELDEVRRRLSTKMNERRVRLSDVRDGAEIAAALAQTAGEPLAWPATKLACALLARVSAAEIDLGFVSGRFARVRDQRGGVKLSKADDQRFSELVRVATDHIANKQWPEAHDDLEALVILLGAPKEPAGELVMTSGK